MFVFINKFWRLKTICFSIHISRCWTVEAKNYKTSVWSFWPFKVLKQLQNWNLPEILLLSSFLLHLKAVASQSRNRFFIIASREKSQSNWNETHLRAFLERRKRQTEKNCRKAAIWWQEESTRVEEPFCGRKTSGFVLMTLHNIAFDTENLTFARQVHSLRLLWFLFFFFDLHIFVRVQSSPYALQHIAKHSSDSLFFIAVYCNFFFASMRS